MGGGWEEEKEERRRGMGGGEGRGDRCLSSRPASAIAAPLAQSAGWHVHSQPARAPIVTALPCTSHDCRSAVRLRFTFHRSSYLNPSIPCAFEVHLLSLSTLMIHLSLIIIILLLLPRRRAPATAGRSRRLASSRSPRPGPHPASARLGPARTLPLLASARPAPCLRSPRSTPHPASACLGPPLLLLASHRAQSLSRRLRVPPAQSAQSPPLWRSRRPASSRSPRPGPHPASARLSPPRTLPPARFGPPRTLPLLASARPASRSPARFGPPSTLLPLA